MAKVEAKITDKMCAGHGSKITKCAGKRPIIHFYRSRSEFTNGYIPYCKDCTQKIFEYYYESSNDFQKATYYTCQKLDIPFKIDLFEYVLKQKRSNQDFLNLSKNYMGKYIGELNKATTKYGTCLDFSYSDTGLSEIDTKIEQRDKQEKELKKFELDWGTHEVDEYAFLEYKWDVYTLEKNLTPSQESLYRQLCLVELSKRRKENNKESTKEEQDMMIKLMDKLKITNFDEQKDKSDTEKIIERQIWEIENTEPAEVVDKHEYEDFLDINKNWGKHILRAVRNLVAGTKDYPNVEKDEWD